MNRTLPLFMGMTLAGLAATAASGQSVGDPHDYVRLGDKIFELGEEFQQGPELFGGIGGVAFDRFGNVFVLYPSDNSVRMFDSTGQFVGRAGRPGRGPGDLARPTQLLHDGDSLLTVVDEVNGLVMFRSNGDGLRHLRTSVLDVQARGACVTESGFVLAGHLNRQSLHHVDRHGKLRHSFGLPFPVTSPAGIPPITDTTAALSAFANTAASLVACLPESDLLIQAQAAGPYVRGYAGNGRLLWTTRIPDYEGTTYYTERSGQNIVVYGPDVTFSLLVLDPIHLLLQVSRRQNERRAGKPATRAQILLRSIVVDTRSGRILADGASLPLLLAISNHVVGEVREDPYPQVVVRRRP